MVDSLVLAGKLKPNNQHALCNRIVYVAVETVKNVHQSDYILLHCGNQLCVIKYNTVHTTNQINQTSLVIIHWIYQ